MPPARCGALALGWGRKTHVMAILNLTPDSFSGDGLAADPDTALARALDAVAAGADLLDVGGESTRPGATPVTAAEEIARVVPLIRALAGRVDVPIAVDTSKAAVAEAALAAGATLLNDVRGLQADPDLAAIAARAGVPVVVMHDRVPDDRGDLLASIAGELARRLDRALAAGIAWEQLIVDPGFGFGKGPRENLELLRRLGELRVLGRPILAGTSRKGTIGRVLGLPPDQRVEGTAATVVLAIAGGADLVRVHDVRAMVRVARMADAVVRGFDFGDDGRQTRTTQATVYIALGSNLGDRAAYLQAALDRLRATVQVTAVSPVYETAPVGYAAQGPFLNAVVAGTTTSTPGELLQTLQAIERAAGRVRSFPNAPRTLDLDLLGYGTIVLDTPDLTGPHPRLHERAFVLAPLADIAPELVLPGLGRTVATLLADLGPTNGIRATAIVLAR